MVPHKTSRGQEALKRIQCCEGIPEEFQKSKRMVVPDCLKIVRLQHGHKFCRLGDLASQVLHLGLLATTSILQLEVFRATQAAHKLYYWSADFCPTAHI